MAPVVFGLNLGDIQWSKFKGSYMFGNTDFHLRRTKFVVYQLAMILCVISESMGTAALSDYVQQQNYVQSHVRAGAEYNNDYIGAASYNIFCGVWVAFIFGGAFFFDLMFPARHENRGVRLAWRLCSAMATVFVCADAATLATITISGEATITGVGNEAEIESLAVRTSNCPLAYIANRRAMFALVFLLFGLPFVFASTIVMWRSLRHDETQGPFSRHAANRRNDIEADGTSMQDLDNSAIGSVGASY